MLRGEPPFDTETFVCAYCGVINHQMWDNLGHPVPITWKTNGFHESGPDWWMSTCYQCQGESVWFQGQVIMVHAVPLPVPHDDLPDELREDYLEAQAIAPRSPRGACALLRLLLEKLCPIVGGNSKTLDRCIQNLVINGLDKETQQMLDIVRVHGNKAVHAGELDPRDDPETVELLFKLVNQITDATIGREKRVNRAYESLPQNITDAIAERNRKKDFAH
jgi:hypothetical protein